MFDSLRIKKSAPALVLIGLAILSFLLAGVLMGNSALDIHMHDTYFIIAHSHLVYLTGAFFAFLAIIYFALRNCLKVKWFHWVHILGTLFCFVLLFYPGLARPPQGQRQRYFDSSSWQAVTQFAELNMLTTSCVIMLLALQIIFFLYVIISGIRCLNK